MIRSCESNVGISHIIISIARAFYEMIDTVQENDILSQSKPFYFESNGKSYCVIFCWCYEIGNKFHCHTLIRTKLSHFKKMNNFCDICNKINRKGTENKRKRDSGFPFIVSGEAHFRLVKSTVNTPPSSSESIFSFVLSSFFNYFCYKYRKNCSSF